MKRILILLAALGAVFAPTAMALVPGKSHGAKVLLRRTSIGKILVNSSGFTLYVFSRDKRNKDNCYPNSSCRATWPPLFTNGNPQAGKGVNPKLLGSIKIARNRRQVTYAGHPLYTYAFDGGPGETSYVGCSLNGGTWNAINGNGRVVQKACG